MRLTNSMLRQSTMVDLRNSLARLQSAQTALSTGKQIRRASDNPIATGSAMSIRNQLRRAEAQERAAGDAKSWLDTADTVLMTSTDLMTRVKELAVRAGNSGALPQGSRDAIAAEVRSIREEVLSIANAEYLDRAIFAGTASGPAYDSAGLYLGNDAAVKREVAPATVVTINMSGEEVFGSQAAPEGDVFAVLDRLATAITAGDSTALETEHANFDAAAKRLNTAVATLGARSSRLETIVERQAAVVERLQTALSEIEDVDLAAAIIDVQTRENAYTASLQAAAKVLPPSLVDFIA